MVTLNHNPDGKLVVSDAGTISEIAQILADYYQYKGYSTTKEDIEEILVLDFLFYAAWATTEGQSRSTQIIDKSAVISVSEWGILDPVVRAHCDYLQSQRVEASGSIGMQHFGLTSSEANQIYMNAKEEMKKTAFVEAPFLVEYEYPRPLNRRVD